MNKYKVKAIYMFNDRKGIIMSKKLIPMFIMALFSIKSFSCADAPANWESKDVKDLNIIESINIIRSTNPFAGIISREELRLGHSHTYIQKIKESTDHPLKKMAVEYTRRLFPIPFDEFIETIKPNEWGKHLSGLVGRCISQPEFNYEGQVISQVERMILKAPFQNADMTKIESIKYDYEKVTVYWRVRKSGNKTTETDIGFVEFKKFEDETLVTFHSAHRLRLFNMPLPSWFIHREIGRTFLKHLEKYSSLFVMN